MGVFDKFKKILFDEEIEEVPTGEELPERTPKKNFRSESGFVDHNGQKDEDVIKEVKYEPKTEEERPVSRTSRYGTEEYEKKEDIPRQISRYEDTKPYMEKEDVESKIEAAIQHEREIPVEVEEPREVEHKYDFGADFDTPKMEEHIAKKDPAFVQTDKYGLRRDYKAILRNESEVRHGELEHKDYAAIVRDKTEATPGKKPFVVTPVISPVYGILDKNYTPDSVIEKNKENSNIDAQKKRLYGEPTEITVEKVTVKTAPAVEEEPTKEDEYLDGIQNIIEEEIPKRATKTLEEAMEDTEEYTPVEPEVKHEEPVEDIPIEDDPITPVEEEPYYEEPEEEVEEEIEAPSVSIDTLIDNPMDDEDEAPRQELDDTIETDLFNLIDSMYNKDEEGE